MLALLLASLIAFASPSPMPDVHVVPFRDAAVHAEIRYRLKPSGFSGPADPGPSIADGTLRLTTGATTRSIDLARLLPLAHGLVVLPHGPHDGCGAVAPIVHTGGYLAIEYLIIGKGCRTGAAFVDVRDGSVVRAAQSAEEWDIYHTDYSGSHPHAYGDRFTTTNGRVVRSEMVTLRQLSDLQSSTTKPWRFGIVTWRDAADRVARFSFAVDSEIRSGATTAAPSPGDAIAVDVQDPRAKWYDASVRFRVTKHS